MRFATDTLNRMTPEQIKEHQEGKLQKQLRYCYTHSDYYRQKFQEAGAHPQDISTLEDFRNLPIFMTKEDERESQQESIRRLGHPFGMHLCAGMDEIEVTSATSGTTGLPTFTYTFSKRDINGPIADLWAFMLRYANVRPGNRVLFAYALGVYATSMILWGIRKSGAIPIDVDVRGGADAILQFAELSKPVSALMTPSLAEYLLEISPASIGKKIAELGIKSLLLCGEPGAGILEKKAQLEKAYGAKVYDFWAPGGVGFGLSCDCREYHGLHCYAPDYNLYQDDLVDPVSKKPIDVVDGARGELVHTSLDRDACPVIRYAYGDIARVYTEDCPHCGFKGKRLKFLGRTDDMMLIKGTNVYPASIQEAVAPFSPKVTGAIKIVLEKPLPKITSPLKIKIEYGKGMDQHQLIELEMQIKSKLYGEFNLAFDIIWVPFGTLNSAQQKAGFFEPHYHNSGPEIGRG